MKERRRDNRAAFPLAKLVELLEGEVLTGRELLTAVSVCGCFATDLMSDVLAFSTPGMLLLTGLATIQAVHAADVAELRAVLFVGGKVPAPPVVDLARQRSIPLATTKHGMAEACEILERAGLETQLR